MPGVEAGYHRCMDMPEVTDHWVDQHNAWKARRERLRADRIDRQQRRAAGLRHRHAAKLANNDKKAAVPEGSETAASSVARGRST